MPGPVFLGERREAEVREEIQKLRERRAARQRGEFMAPEKLPKRREPVPKRGIKILCIGDSHARPEVPNHRYDWLGRMIVDEQPDVVWDAGDWWDFPSLSSYDGKGSRQLEGRRYIADVDAGIDAQERVRWQMEEYNRGSRKPYKPRWVRTLGNHEARIKRMLDANPGFEGLFGLHDLESSEFGWEEIPFLVPITIAGIDFAHYFVAGIMGRPVHGVSQGRSLILKRHKSCVQGHDHLLSVHRETIDHHAAIGISVGCYFDYDFDWAPPQVNAMYARGIVILDDARDGQADMRWVGLDEIRRRYA